MNKFTTKQKIIFICAAISLLIVGIVCFTLLGPKKSMKQILQGGERAGDVIFAETQSGNLMYVPLNEKEAVMEMSSPSGESLYLWLETGQTVAISDDVIVTDQKTLYEMMYAVIDNGRLSKKNNTYYATITGFEAIYDLMVNDWHLTDGQAMGSLSCYDDTLTKDITMKLAVKSDSEGKYFQLALFVDNKAYSIYNAVLLEQKEKDLPKFDVELYNLGGINTTGRNEYRVEAYANQAIDYFYKLAVFLNVQIPTLEDIE